MGGNNFLKPFQRRLLCLSRRTEDKGGFLRGSR
nr:MAG TPA: hypothetical protein [Caudoviricetes sp.]